MLKTPGQRIVNGRRARASEGVKGGAVSWPQMAGEMARRVRDHDWAATPLGPIECWPQSLKTMVDVLLSSGHAMMLAWGPTRTILYNDAYAPLMGNWHPAGLGLPLRDAWPDVWDEISPLVERAFAGETVRFENMPLTTTRHGDPERSWWTFSYSPVRNEAGEVIGLLNVTLDTTAHVRAETALLENEARHRLLIETWAQAVWEIDPDGVVVADSPSWRAYTGQTLEEWLGYGWLDAIHPDDRARAERQWREAVAAREPVNAEFRLRAPDGGWRWTNVRAAPVLDAEGNIEKWAGINIDIDARKRAEAALREGEERYRALFAASPAPFLILKPDAPYFTVTEVNDAYLAATMRRREEVIGRGVFEAFPDNPADAGDASVSTLRASLEKVLATRQSDTLPGLKYDIARPDGKFEQRWWNPVNSPVLDGRGKVVAIIHNANDVTEALRADAALAESEAQYRLLFNSVQDGFCVIEVLFDANDKPCDYKFLKVNPAFERQTGLRDTIGRTILSMVPEQEPFWFETYGRIVRTGRSEQFDHRADALGRWYEVDATPIGEPGENQVAVVFRDVLQRRKAEEALRESEEKYRSLFETMGQGYAECELIRDANGRAIDYRFIELNPAFERLIGVPAADARGRTVSEVIPGIEPWWPETYDRIIQAGVPERIEYEVATLRGWYEAHAYPQGGDRFIALFENITERKRAEAALRESEERFQQFATASAAGLWIRNADTLVMEFVSPSMGAIYGVEPGGLSGEVKTWAAMIVPDDRDLALRHLEEARAGSVAMHEFRIQRPSDGAFRWIRNTDFPLRDDGHIPRIGGIAEDVTEAKLAAEHTAVLLAELQHRVRNIMALLRSITNRTADRAESVPEYRDLMIGRLLAFARVQALLTRAANVSVGIASIVRDEVGVQAQHEGQYVLDGPDVTLSPKAAEVLTLAIHELATNAVKYGALSVPTGRITVRWSTFEKRGGPWLAFDWTEEGAPPRPAPASDAPRRRGFGSELIEARIPYELRGRGQVTIEPGGARCHLEFPLQHGASILETGAPRRATVFGGAIDMTGEADLTGRRVLVVEDDFYLATDAARALRGAGAEVMGPCATEEDARAELAEQRPDVAVVDINLGAGPSFKLAEALKDRGIPFVFTTGYDAGVIPAEFGAVERLEKPLQLRQIVGAVAKLTTAA